MKLLFATHNLNKLSEVKKLIPSGIELLSLRDVNIPDEIPETGTTLQDNALIKARFASRASGLNCFADDSGLEVEALNGAPGVYSARYAGLQKNDADNNRKLLQELNDQTNRNAVFKTVIALIWNDKEYLFEGSVTGKITKEKIGTGGFGYDPVFMPGGHDLTFAQLSMDEKNRISHRAKAVNKLVDFLRVQTP